MSGFYYPKTKDVDFDEEERTWRTKGAISIAPRQFASGERRLVVATMMKDNALSGSIFIMWASEFVTNLDDQTIDIPGFKKLTPDILKCHEITVKRELERMARAGTGERRMVFRARLILLACQRPRSSQQNPQSMGGRHKSCYFLKRFTRQLMPVE
jgi:hypothetical protein